MRLFLASFLLLSAACAQEADQPLVYAAPADYDGTFEGRNVGGGLGLQLGPLGAGAALGLGPQGFNFGGGLGFNQYQHYGTPTTYKKYYGYNPIPYGYIAPHSRNLGGGLGLQVGPVGAGLAGGLGLHGLNFGGGLGFQNYQNYGTPAHYQQFYYRPGYTTYQSLPQASRNFGGGVGLQLGPVGFGLAGGLGPNGLNAGGGLGFANYQNYGTPGHYKQYYTRYPSTYQYV